MRQKIAKKATFWLGVIAVGLMVGVSIQFGYAWIEPSSNPPAGNVSAPINVSEVGQSKGGPLIVNGRGVLETGLTVNRNLIVLNGNVGIGTTNPELKLDVRSRNAKIQMGTNSSNDAGILIWRDNSNGLGFWSQADANIIASVYAGKPLRIETNWPAFNTPIILNASSVGVGTNDPHPATKLHVNGNLGVSNGWVKFGSLASDPAGASNGAMYYNSATNRFRCYQGGAWANCGGSLPSNSITSTGVANQVAFFNGANSIIGENDFYWDAANNRLGIMTSSPSNPLSFGSGQNQTIAIENIGGASNGRDLTLRAGSHNGNSADRQGGNLILSSGASTGTGSSYMSFYTATPGVSGTTLRNPTEKMRITGDGKVGIGTTDPAYKLDVEGTIDYDNQKTCSYAQLGGVDGIIKSETLSVPASWRLRDCARMAYDACAAGQKASANCVFQLACAGSDGKHRWTQTYRASTYVNSAQTGNALYWYVNADGGAESGYFLGAANFCGW